MREHTDMPDNIKIHHTLWGLALLKIYDTEKVICDHVGARDEKNFRKWSWGSVGWLANLEPYVVSQNPTERFDCLTDFYIDWPLMHLALEQIYELWDDRHKAWRRSKRLS